MSPCGSVIQRPQLRDHSLVTQNKLLGDTCTELHGCDRGDDHSACSIQRTRASLMMGWRLEPKRGVLDRDNL